MENKEKVLAKVATHQITESDLEHMLKNLNPQIAANFQGEQGKQALLQELVNQKLFYLEALENSIENDAKFQSEFENLKENFVTQYSIQNLINSVSVTHEELETYYNENKEGFISPQKVQASHILVSDVSLAEEVKGKLAQGESFEALAKEYSSCPSKERGGDLGMFGEGQMVPEFEEAAFKMAVGEVSEPVETQFGFHIIKVTDKQESGLLSFEEVRSNLLRNMMAEKQGAIYQNHIADLKSKYNVEVL